jgi:hypothetical protein
MTQGEVKQRPQLKPTVKYHLISPRGTGMLVTRQSGKAAICAAGSSFGNSTQRPRPKKTSCLPNGHNQSSAIPAVWTGHGGYCMYSVDALARAA